jgi:hypothetical protein
LKQIIDVSAYLALQERSQRIAFLQDAARKTHFVPFDVVRDLFCFDLSVIERILLLETMTVDNSNACEEFIFSNFLSWDQSVAATAIRVWARSTGKIILLPTQLCCQRVPSSLAFQSFSLLSSRRDPKYS